MVSVIVSSAVYREFELRSDQTKDYEIGICCFSSKQPALRVRAKTNGLGNRILCPSGAVCLPADCCFSELAL